MSDTNDTHGKAYFPGMMWEGSMFPFAPRNESIWGSQDPLEFIPPAGPFDDQDGEQSWRVSNDGRDIYTGEVHVRSRAPNALQQELRDQFWRNHVVHKAQVAGGNVQHRRFAEAAASTQFPDAPPVHSDPASIENNNTVQRPVTLLPALTLVIHQPQQVSGLVQEPPAQPSSDVDGEYEIDDEYSPEVAHNQLTRVGHDEEQLADSTPPKISSPRGIDDWDNDNLLSFYKFKVIRKKGYEPMLVHFPGQTIESLQETWKTHRKRCEELGAAWRAAGKPAGSVAEWLDE